MNIITDYKAIAGRLYAERMKKGRDYAHSLYREWYLALGISPFSDFTPEETGDYKEFLRNMFEVSRQFINHLDTFRSGNKSIIYLHNVGKLLAEDQEGTHPALLPFLDTVETLRRLSYLVAGPNMADKKLPLRHPPLWNFTTVNMTAVNKMSYVEHYKRCRETMDIFDNGELSVPTAKAINEALDFLTGPLFTFMYEQFLACGPRGIHTILIYPMFTTDPDTPVFPEEIPEKIGPVQIKEGLLLTAEECYFEAQRKQYMEELERLERKRNENAFFLLEQAEQSSFNVEKDKLFPAEVPGSVFPELTIFYKILQKAIPLEVLQEQLEKEMTNESLELPSLFPDTYFFSPTEKQNYRNMSITKATKRLIRGYAMVNINGNTLSIKNDEGEVIQEVAFSDATGKPSDQIINSFDMSIADCVGSLQQKNPNRNHFTDIDIAKEFNSTEDKKGHITPDSPIVQDVHESMKKLSSVYGKLDITQQIALEMKRRFPDKKKIKRLESGKERLSIMQPLVKIDGIGVHEFGKRDKDAICYIIKDPPPFYLHGALSKQMIQVPFEQLNTPNGKKALTKEIRLLREYTRRNIEATLSMMKHGKSKGTITFNKILDDTFRTSADPAENVEELEITQVVKNIPEWKRYKMQTQILDYVQELKEFHKVLYDYEIVKKKVPGKSKVIACGFKIILEKKSPVKGKSTNPQTRKNLPPNP